MGANAAPAAHAVQFYDEFPAAEIAESLAEGISRGEGVLILATAEHRAALDRILSGRGAAPGQIVHLDATDLVDRIMATGVPDLEPFAAQVFPRVDDLVVGFGRVRAYGEVVDLLWQRGLREVALALETLWLEPLSRYPVSLLCGYALASFDEDVGVHGFHQVCEAHGAVQPAKMPVTPPFGLQRLQAELQQRSRALVSVIARRRTLEQERTRLADAERRARAEATTQTEHLQLLQQVTSALSEAVSSRDIARVVSTMIASAVRADQAILAIPTGRGQLRLLGYMGFSREQIEAYGVFPCDAPLPIAAAFRAGAPVWFASKAESTREYPLLEDWATEAVACLPIALGAAPLGAIGFGYLTERVFSPPDRALFEDLAKQVAFALDRARLYEAARRSGDRLRLLADASARFSEARLDLRQVLDAVVIEVTARSPDGCAIHLLSRDRATLDAAAVRHFDAEAEEAVRPRMVEVVQTGRAALLPAAVIVPLRASGAILGALTVVRGQGGAAFTTDDQALLQDLGDRAALSIANALLYAEAERERRRAEEANRTKDEFLAMLGHELRNPLSPILTALELMKLRGARSASQREHEVIERQVRVMVRLIDDLLDVSRIAQGKVTLRKERVEAAAVVAKAIEMASPLLEQRRHKLTVSAPPDGLPVHGDESRLSQVVANLLINAAKYTNPGGHVAVEASGDGGQLTIRVRDDGVGIPAEILPQLFKLFVQAERALDRAPGGLGIGLTVAKSLVELHGGSISACSDGPGRGSEFTVRLPLLAADAVLEVDERPSSPGASPTPSRRRGERLLVVDDNRDAADALGEALEEVGYVVEVAYDGPSALALASRFQPAVALLDIGLPAMDGYELAAKLRERPDAAALRLVAVTGYGQDEDRARARAAGFHAHVVKPVELAMVKSLVDAELAARRGAA